MRVRVPLIPLVLGLVLVLAPQARATGVTDLPITQTLTFPQLSAPVDVVRDNYGIPHVYASTLNDAAFVMGYIHATDRLFQMDVFRRIPSGTVSELLGFPDLMVGAGPDPTVPPFPGNISNVTQDLFFQTLGMRRAAQDSFNAMSPTVQSALQAYADGVNEVIAYDNATGHLPPEYTGLNITQVAPWTPIDSVSFGKLQAFQLSFDFDDGPTDDLANVEAGLGVATGKTAYFDDLARIEPAENAFTVPDGNGTPIPLANVTAAKPVMVADAAAAAKPKAAKGERKLNAAQRRAIADARKATIKKAREYIAQLMEQPAMRAIRERGVVGSNEWAVDGSVTDTGNPILANDPHLALSSPATFYELHINTKDRGGDTNVTGIGFAGAPGVVQGHNEHIAWGSTTNPTDVTDWYLEDISSDAGGNLFSHYLGNPEPVQTLPLQVKVNTDNGNLTGIERIVVATAAGISFPNLHGVVDITPLLANFVPPKVLIVPRHGPIFPQTLSPYPFPANHTGGSALSIQYTGLFPTRELETFFVWNKATNLADFKSGLQLFDFGSQNWAYSDDQGNIAYFTSGEFPLREDIQAGSLSGNPPFMIRNGSGGNEWIPQPVHPADQSVPYQIVPAADMPQIENPPAHFFANANNDPNGNTADNDPLNEALAGTAPYLGVGYDEFRAARITELIKSELNLIPTPPGTPAGNGTISFADMQRMQSDVNQLEARRLAGFFVTAVNDAQAGGAPTELSSLLNSRILDARDRLAAWTYNTRAGFDTPGDPGVPSAQDLVDSVATTIYNVAIGQLVTNTFDAKLAAASVSYRTDTTGSIRGLLRLLNKVPFTGVGVSGINFFDDTSVSLAADVERDMLLVKSLQSALNLLSGAGFADAYASSTNIDDYLWGKVHYVIFTSFVDGQLNDTHIPGAGIFDIPPQPAASFPPGMPRNGARFTVNVANFGMRPTDENGLSFGSGSNRRSVVEMGPTGPVRAKNVIPGGEDGVVGRPHYGDQVNLWLSGTGYHDTLLKTDDVVAAAESRDNFPSLPGCTESGTGRCIPGKGSGKTDCVAEYFIDAPVTADNIQKAKITITDGGPSDVDGTANGTCVVHMVICVNNADPRITTPSGAMCSSPDVDVFTLRSPRPDSSKPEDQANANAIIGALKTLGPNAITGDHKNEVDYGPALTTANKCVGTYVQVSLKHGEAVKKSFKTKVARSDRTKDLDKVVITCAP